MASWKTKAPLRPMKLAFRKQLEEIDRDFMLATAKAKIQKVDAEREVPEQEPLLAIETLPEQNSPPSTPPPLAPPSSPPLLAPPIPEEEEEFNEVEADDEEADDEVATIFEEKIMSACYNCGDEAGPSQLCSYCKNHVKRGCFLLGKRDRE